MAKFTVRLSATDLSVVSEQAQIAARAKFSGCNGKSVATLPILDAGAVKTPRISRPSGKV